MPIQVIMPQLGESVVEGTVSKWLKNIGDEIKEYDPLLEVNTDKVDSEIPSPASGTLLAVLVDEGTLVNAGTLLAWIGDPGEVIPEEGDTHPEAKPIKEMKSAEVAVADLPSPPPVFSPGRDEGLGFISPVVAKISSEEGIDLSQVQGTGQGGRITKKDVLAYIELQKKTGVGKVSIPTETPVSSTKPTPHPSQKIIPGEILPHTIVRRSIAEHMLMSKRTSPHVTTVMEANLKNVVAHRHANKSVFSQGGVNLTFTAYFVAATVAALKTYPIVNSS